MTRTAFVTGATGFVGRHLIEQLAAGGWRIVAFHRPSSDLSVLGGLEVEPAAGVLHERESVAAAMPKGVDAVFHVAADTSMWSGHRDRQVRTNVDGTRAVVRAAIERGAGRLVHTSTWGTFDLERSGEITEGSPRAPADSPNGYVRTQLLAEDEVIVRRRRKDRVKTVNIAPFIRHIRLRGRAVSIRVSSDQENTSWRLGVPRLEMRTDGSR